MSVFVVRNGNGHFLHAPGAWVCVADFKDDYKFTSEEDARHEADVYPTWREVVRVTWALLWYDEGKRDTDRPWRSKENTPNRYWTEKKERRHFKTLKDAHADLKEHWSWCFRNGFGAKVVRLMRVVKP